MYYLINIQLDYYFFLKASLVKNTSLTIHTFETIALGENKKAAITEIKDKLVDAKKIYTNLPACFEDFNKFLVKPFIATKSDQITSDYNTFLELLMTEKLAFESLRSEKQFGQYLTNYFKEKDYKNLTILSTFFTMIDIFKNEKKNMFDAKEL